MITAILELFKTCIITRLAFVFCGSPFFLVPEMITGEKDVISVFYHETSAEG